MDPISTLLAVYMSAANNHVSDIYGAEIKTEIIEYDGTKVKFQYQLWKIKNKTVCSTYKQDMGEYSKCTVNALALFSSICDELSIDSGSHWKVKKLKNMYCNAATNYEPVIAMIAKPKKANEQQDIKKKCNLLILKTMGNTNKDLIAEKDFFCEQIK